MECKNIQENSAIRNTSIPSIRHGFTLRPHYYSQLLLRKFAKKLLILYGFCWIGACDGRDYVYPTSQDRDVQYMCSYPYTSVESPDYPYIKDSVPKLLMVTEDRVTIFFSNQRTQTLTKPGSIALAAGTYKCS